MPIAFARARFGDEGQPALLWIVPCMLATVTASAVSRSEFNAMWHGEQPAVGSADEQQRLRTQSADGLTAV